MQIGIVSLFPKMFHAITDFGVTGKAIDKGLVNLHYWNPRDYTTDKYQTVDDKSYGGGPGMVMKVGPLRHAIKAAKKALGANSKVIYLSPQGKQITQKRLGDIANISPIILVSGRYEGVDERLVESEIDEEWSIGDYVLSGGELAAMVVIDVMARLVPGVLGDSESAQQDSFMSGLLDYPHYTRPEVVDDMCVPNVLLSGDHDKIRRWRLKMALGRTWQRRADLLSVLDLTEEQLGLLEQFIAESKQ